MSKSYPKRLSRGANNVVVALSETEAAKLYDGDTRSDIGSEAEKLKFANAVNNLVVKLIRLDYSAELQAELLVLERLYPMDYRSIEVEKRELFFDVFADDLAMLHRSGFVHRDLRRPSTVDGERYDNVFLTQQGLRLIDVGISALRSQVGEKLFEKYVELELQELREFKVFFLER